MAEVRYMKKVPIICLDIAHWAILSFHTELSKKGRIFFEIS